MPDKKSRGISNLANSIPDVPDAPTVSASNVGTSRAYNNGAATVTITPTTGGLPSSYSITTTPTTTTTVATSSPATITGLSSATSYTVTVTPSNVSATGTATTSSSFTATTVPQAPTIGAFTDGGTGTTGTLSFTAGATGGSAITGYTYSTDGTNYSAASGTTSPLSLTGLTVGTYTFYLKATNANGTSLASTGVSGTVIQPTAFESIASSSPTSGTSITFSSIPSTYSSLQLRFAVIPASSGNPSLYITYNGDTGSNYTVHTLRGNGTAASAAGATARANFPLSWYYGMVPTYQNVAIMDIIDYASTSKYKTARAFYGQNDNAAAISSNLELNSGLWLSTSAINSITVTVSGGLAFASGSVIALYGIKGA